MAVGLPISNFYPRSPCGERRFSSGAKADTVSFLSTLSLRRATPRPPKKHQWPDISIHALLAESDLDDDLLTAIATLFLSTLSLRRATVDTDGLVTVPPEDFYPRSPCGERRILSDMANAVFEFLSTLSLRRATGIADTVALALDISIHALLAESDTSIRCSLNHYLAFLSTLSLRRATISPTGAGAPPHNFYPRSPCGERLYGFRLMMAVFLFLSTLSLRRATRFTPFL